VIDWDGAKVVDRETYRCAVGLKKKDAIWIRKTEPTMNRDEGGYWLVATDSFMFGTVCLPHHLVSSEDIVPDENYRWWLKRRCEFKIISCERRIFLNIK